jgi:hypothetical protein
LLTEWLPGIRVVRDHSWGLIENVVLEVQAGRERYIVKADGESNHHILRELDAHQLWLAPWVALGRAPQLVAGDRHAKILVTKYLPLGSASSISAERHRGQPCPTGCASKHVTSGSIRRVKPPSSRATAPTHASAQHGSESAYEKRSTPRSGHTR